MSEPCPGFEDLSAYLDGQLPPRARARLDAHLASCPACAASLADLRTLRTDLQALPDERLGFDLAQVIRGRIEALPPRTKARRAPRWRRLPPVGIGSDSVVENAIIDKNARIGAGVRIVNQAQATDLDGDGYYVRDGIVIVPKDGVIADGRVI